LDFAEGLRVIGVRPNEKLALFADNSCRWLVADQGVYRRVYFLYLFSLYCVSEHASCTIYRSICAQTFKDRQI